MEFLPGLNLIGGENGTLKTKLLQQLRGGSFKATIPNPAPRIQAISPKRNSERRAAEQMWQQFRQQNRTLDALLNERISAQIKDSGFDNYPSVGELYYLDFEHRAKDGGDRRNHMRAVTEDMNSVIRSVFQQYQLVSEWNSTSGVPMIRIRKGSSTEFPIEGLSLGEQEILGLITTIYAARDRTDVYLIDEPEVHLNWHLEEKLFAFLDDLCESHGKQAIVVTHSRAMFTPRYLPKTQFLYWDDQKVKWGRQLTPEQQRRIAGEAIEIIKLGNFSNPTFFVEDAGHARILGAVARCFGVAVTISQCGNSPNVKSLFKLSRHEGGWSNSFFLVDGDNEGNPFPESGNFIHLPVYCSDNILLSPEQLSATFGLSVSEIQRILRDAILDRRDQVLKRNKFFGFMIDQLRPEHLTYESLSTLDASEIIDRVAELLGTNTSDLTERIVTHLHSVDLLKQYLPTNLVDAFAERAVTAAG